MHPTNLEDACQGFESLSIKLRYDVSLNVPGFESESRIWGVVLRHLLHRE